MGDTAWLIALPGALKTRKGGNLRKPVVLIMMLAASVLFVNCEDEMKPIIEIPN